MSSDRLWFAQRSRFQQAIACVLAPGGRLLSLISTGPDKLLVRAAYLAYLTVVGSVPAWCFTAIPTPTAIFLNRSGSSPGARGALLKPKDWPRASYRFGRVDGDSYRAQGVHRSASACAG